MNDTLKFPFYAKFAFISIGVFAFICTMYIGQQIILPLIYATIIAILLNPLVNFLVRIRIHRTVAIFVAVGFTIILTVGLMYFIFDQLSLFSETYPRLKEKFNDTSEEVIAWISIQFNIKEEDIKNWIDETSNEAMNNMGGAISQTLYTINSVLFVILLLPVYLFMILFYKSLLLQFIHKIFDYQDHTAVFDVLTGSKKIIQGYLIGLLVEVSIVAALNSMGLLLLGIQYAIILGIIGALLNIIPYIGGVISISLPMIIAFITKDSSTYVFLVLGLYLLIQFIDNNFIIPHIVASKVKINALMSLIAVLVGGAIWGVPGMFLSIPLTAILKVVFDHIESLKPWGFLLGNIVPTTKLNFDSIKKKVYYLARSINQEKSAR